MLVKGWVRISLHYKYFSKFSLLDNTLSKDSVSAQIRLRLSWPVAAGMSVWAEEWGRGWEGHHTDKYGSGYEAIQTENITDK